MPKDQEGNDAICWSKTDDGCLNQMIAYADDASKGEVRVLRYEADEAGQIVTMPARGGG